MSCQGFVAVAQLVTKFHFFPQAMEKVTVTYVTGDGGSLLKARLVLQLHSETSLAQVAAKLCDTCLEILGAEVPREDQTELQLDLAGILQEIHSKELCKNEGFTALGTLKGVQWVGLGSNLKTRNRAFWLGKRSSCCGSRRARPNARLQQFRHRGTIGATGCTATPRVLGAIQDSHERRDRGISIDVPTER